MHVLVIDDNQSIGQLIEQTLSEEGHRVQVVRSHGEALELLQGTPFDVIIADGFARTRSRALPEAEQRVIHRLSAHAPVIVSSAWGWAVDVTAEGIGAAAVLPKPFDLDDLIRTVEAVGRPEGRQQAGGD